MRKGRDTHLWRHKRNGKLYVLSLLVRSMYLGPVYTAEPYMHDKHVGNKKTGLTDIDQFEKAYVRNDL